jgi:hypothetical protein
MLLTSTHHPVIKKVLGMLTNAIVCRALMTKSNWVVSIQLHYPVWVLCCCQLVVNLLYRSEFLDAKLSYTNSKQAPYQGEENRMWPCRNSFIKDSVLHKR